MMIISSIFLSNTSKLTCDADLNVSAGRDVGDEADLQEVLAGHRVETSEHSNLDPLQVPAEPDQAAQGVLTYLLVRPGWIRPEGEPGPHEELVIEYFLPESLLHWPRPGDFSLGKLSPVNRKPSDRNFSGELR